MSGRPNAGPMPASGTLRRRSSPWIALGIVAALGCDRGDVLPLPELPETPEGARRNDAGPGTFSDGAIGRNDLSLDRLVPDHGSYLGGSRAVLRGSGFDDRTQVTIGGRAVQPADHELIDSRRLAVIVPAGEVGPADVVVAREGVEPITLEDGYTYDALSIDPPRGATAGGTLVTIEASTSIGAPFEEGETVVLGRTECEDVEIVSTTRVTCRTPPSSAGYVDVIVRRAADGSEIRAVEAYQYYDSTDPVNGGLGGGPIAGSINVTAIDARTSLPVADAFAFVGDAPALDGSLMGVTDALGQVTLSTEDLAGPVTIQIAKHCYERTSIVAFDASNVTVFMEPWLDLDCAMGMGMGGPTGPSRGRNGSFIQGELIWRGPNEFGPNPWDNIPEPRAGWQRVAYVYTTIASMTSSNPDPWLGGARQRVLEQDGSVTGVLGYPYSIFARPAGLAVYAIAGLENPAQGRFVPYVMGVARSVLAGPGEVVSGVDVVMDIPLDHDLDVEIGALPSAVRDGPRTVRVQAMIDLGGEGLVSRIVGGENFDVLRSQDRRRDHRFVGQPAFGGTLADARYRIVASWLTAEAGTLSCANVGFPCTAVVANGVIAVDDVVALPEFLSIPEPVTPRWGERLGPDRVLRWTDEGPAPDYYLVRVVGADRNPYAQMFVRGDVHEVPFPDLSPIPGLEDIVPGYFTWRVTAIRIPGFDFDTFSYAHLNQRYWSQYAVDEFTGER